MTVGPSRKERETLLYLTLLTFSSSFRAVFAIGIAAAAQLSKPPTVLATLRGLSERRTFLARSVPEPSRGVLAEEHRARASHRSQ